MRRWRYEPIYYRQRMFDEFAERDATGRVRFENRLPEGAMRSPPGDNGKAASCPA